MQPALAIAAPDSLRRPPTIARTRHSHWCRETAFMSTLPTVADIDSAWYVCVPIVALVALTALWCCRPNLSPKQAGARRNNKPVPILSVEEQQQRAQARKERKLYASGKVRMCRFCEVIVAPEHMAAHLNGKKHKRLVGDDALLDEDEIWRWIDAPAATAAAGSAESAEAAAKSAALQATEDDRNGWSVAGPPKKRSTGKKSGSRLEEAAAAEAAAAAAANAKELAAR